MSTSIATRNAVPADFNPAAFIEPAPVTLGDLINALQAIQQREGSEMPVYLHHYRQLLPMRISERRVDSPQAAPTMVYRNGTRCPVLHAAH